MKTDLAARLQHIGLRALPASSNDFLASAARKRWSPRQLLEQFAAAKSNERDRRSLERRLRLSGIKTFKPVAGFDWAWPAKIERDLLNARSHSSFSRRRATSFSSDGMALVKPCSPRTSATPLCWRAVPCSSVPPQYLSSDDKAADLRGVSQRYRDAPEKETVSLSPPAGPPAEIAFVNALLAHDLQLPNTPLRTSFGDQRWEARLRRRVKNPKDHVPAVTIEVPLQRERVARGHLPAIAGRLNQQHWGLLCGYRRFVSRPERRSARSPSNRCAYAAGPIPERPFLPSGNSLVLAGPAGRGLIDDFGNAQDVGMGRRIRQHQLMPRQVNLKKQ
jgi:hypothetical protein